jgi:hypothetical protein
MHSYNIDYLDPKIEEKERKRLQKFKDQLFNLLKKTKFSIDDKIIISSAMREQERFYMWAYFALKKIDEPYFQISEFLKKIKHSKNRNENNKRYDCFTVELPWFLWFNTLEMLTRKYFKGQAHQEAREAKAESIYPFFKCNDIQTKWEGPSNNPMYRWLSDWEYNLNPVSFKNLKEFMKARVKEVKKYSKHIIENRLKEEEIEKQKVQEELRYQEEKKKKQKEIELKNLNNQRYEKLDEVVKDSAVYIICEINKVFTKKQNKCNSLYVGESQSLAKRFSVYQDLTKNNNELVNKLMLKTSKTREQIIEKLNKNIRVRKLINFKSLSNENFRREIEGYLINRLNPLLNTSKRGGYYKRSFFNKEDVKKTIITEDFDDYKEDLKMFFFDSIYETNNPDSENIFHVEERRFVKRKSTLGEEAEEIQIQRSFNSWFKKENLMTKFEYWRTNPEKFYEELD